MRLLSALLLLAPCFSSGCGCTITWPIRVPYSGSYTLDSTYHHSSGDCMCGTAENMLCNSLTLSLPTVLLAFV